jgi:hypothetical protein
MISKRLREILQKNAEFEKEAPYNFCDRWCERCSHEKQMRCKIYQDEFEQKMTCIAHGKEPGDPEITKEVMKRQFEEIGEELEQFAEEDEIDFDDLNDPEFEKIRKHIRFVENNPLQVTAERYLDKANKFLEKTFYKDTSKKSELVRDFETVSWYHTLLPVKLNMALAGFHEPACEGDLSLYDAVAQFEICKKAIRQLIEALRKIDKHMPSYHDHVLVLLTLLHNMCSRIEMMEESI